MRINSSEINAAKKAVAAGELPSRVVAKNLTGVSFVGLVFVFFKTIAKRDFFFAQILTASIPCYRSNA
jgi:hypothetical protein